MITKIDNTSFEFSLLTLYYSYISSWIKTKIKDYVYSDYNIEINHWFNLLFLTPSNLASDYYKTDFFITSVLINGIQMRNTQDKQGMVYTDITNVDEQIYFKFED